METKFTENFNKKEEVSLNLEKRLLPKVTLIVNNELIEPVGEVKLVREMKKSPSSLEIKFRKEDTKNIELGNTVIFKYDNSNVFKGFVFVIEESEDDIVNIKAYDQLRYLKNSHTLAIKNKTVTQLIGELCKQFGLQVGDLADTKVDIAPKQKLIENKALFEIIQDGILETMRANLNKNVRILNYILYDDFGSICLKEIFDLKVNIRINEDNIIKFKYSEDIDNETYNRVYLYYKDDETHKVQEYMKVNADAIKKWGVLQKTIDTPRITKAQAQEYSNQLLTYYGTPKKEFIITTAIGDVEVRGGSMIPIEFNTNKNSYKSYFVVDKVTHTFSSNEHTMELTLLGVDMA